MSNKKRLNSYEDLPLVLDVADIQQIMGISRASAYELVHTPGFPAFRSGRLIKVSKTAFFEWMAKGSETVPMEWSFFLNDRSRITYNELCRKCQHECKQSFRAVVVDCPKYLSKRSKKKDKTAGNGKIP